MITGASVADSQGLACSCDQYRPMVVGWSRSNGDSEHKEEDLTVNVNSCQ